MNAQSSMFDLMTSEDSGSITSLPASADGPTRSSSPDGPTTSKSGPEAVPVSPSQWQAQARATLTSATSGLSFGDSSPSAALSMSLGSRLQERLASCGAPEYTLTWKRSRTASGLPFYRLRASEHRTKGTASSGPPTGWPTPNTMDSIERDGLRPSRTATGRTGGYIAEVLTAGWPTPQAHDVTTRGNTAADHHHYPHDLSNAVLTAGWPTPDAYAERGGPQDPEKRKAGGHSVTLQDAVAGWATPRVTDSAGAASTRIKNANKDTDGPYQLREQVFTAIGLTPTSSNAETGSRGALHPAFPCWLQGYPAEWVSCVVSAIQSSPRWGKRLSAPTWKQEKAPSGDEGGDGED